MSPIPAQNSSKDFYLISELASILKVSTHTIRNLENEFGIEVKKDFSGRRVYTFSDIQKYQLIIDKKNTFDYSTSTKTKSNSLINDSSVILPSSTDQNISSNVIFNQNNVLSLLGNFFYSLFSTKSLSYVPRFSLFIFVFTTITSFGSFYLDSLMDLEPSVGNLFGINSSNVGSVLQATDENWDYRFDVNVPAYFNNSLVGSSASFELITVGDRVVISPTGIIAPNIINSVQTLPDEQILLVDATDINNPILSITNNPSFDSINVNSLNGVISLDDTTITTIEDSINIPTPNTNATTFGGFSVTDFLRSNSNTTFTNGIMTFDATSSLKFNNIDPNTFLKVDSSNNLVGYQILPGLNVDFTSTANSLTINVSTNPIATQNYTSLAVNTLYLGTSSFDTNYEVLATASDLNKLFTLSGNLLTTTNLISLFPVLDTDASNDITTANLASSILSAFPLLDTNSSNDVLISSLATLMLTNYVNLDTDATNDITNTNFSSTLFTLFPNIDTNASDDYDILQDAVLIGSNAGKNVYSENVWFGYQNFNRASASIFEVEANGKITFDGGVLPAITDNALYSYDDVLYFQETPVALLSNHNVNTHNNRFAIFSTNGAGKLQLSGSTNVGLSYIQTGSASSILGMDGSSLRYLNVVGDLSISTTSSSNITFTFNNVNSNIGTFGSDIAIPQITVNSKGLITGVSTVPFSSVTNPNNYVTGISFSIPAVSQRTLVLQRQGLTDLTAMFSISGSDITTALGYTPLRNTSDSLTGNLGVSGTFSAATGSFTNLSSQNANFSNLTLANALGVIYGGTGNIDVPQAGQILIGNGAGYSLSALTAGTNITISTGAGSITISGTAGGSNANNYVNAISFSDASSTIKTLILSREGLANLTASFSISAANVTSALGYTPFNAANFTATQIINTLGYTPLNSTAFNAVNITNALGYVPFGPTNFVAGTNISLSSTATSLTINSSFTDTTNPNNYVSAISFSDASATIKTLTLTREGLANLTASFSLSSSDITSALGYTPLRNTSDTLAGNLTVTGSLSAATIFQGGNQVCDFSGNCAGLGGGIVGSGNAGFISLFTATNSIANSSIYQSLANGYIGIGTTNPGELLDVYGAIKLSQNMGTEARGNALYQDNGVLYWNGQAVGVVGSTAPGGISGTKDYIPFFNTKDTLIASEIYYESGTTERSIELVANTVIPTYLGIGHKNQYSLKLGVAANTNAFYTVYDSEDDVALVNTANISTADLLFALENTDGKILFMFGKGNAQTAPFAMTYNSGTNLGSFGINTTNPTYNLEVIGSAKITDTLAARIFSNPNSNNFVFLSGGNFNGNLSAGSANLTGLTLASALGVAYGGTGLTATPNAGQLLIGNGTGFTLSALTAGSNVSISTTAGGITISSSYIDTTNPNNYVTGVSFVDSGATYKLFTLDREGLSSLTAVFSISSADITTALGFIPQVNLGYTPLDSNAFNAVNITNALGYIPFGASNFVAGNNVSISTTATSITISSTDTTNPNNFVSAISFSAPASAQRVLNLSRTGLSTLTADFTLNQSDIVTALGYIPLNNSSDFMTGSLGVATSFSAATGTFTNLTLANALGVTYGGTGLTSTPNLGQLLIGNGTGYTLSALTAGTGITISTGAGSIQLSSSLVDTNNYVTGISFSDASDTIKTLTLTQLGLANLTASFSLSAANITSALGFTPVNKAGDTISGNLAILQTLSAQDVVVSDNLFVGDYANSAYTLQIEPKVGTLARRIVLDLVSGSQTETTLGMFIQSVKFSAPSSAELKNLTFNQVSSTNDLIVDILKAGTLPAVSNGVLDTYNSQVSAASLYLAANTTNTPQIKFASSNGVNLNSPSAGDLWWNGSNLYFNDGTSNIDIIDNVSDVLLGATVYSTTATAVANGGYIELVHNQNSNDILADAWIYNSTTSKWEKFYADSEGNQVIDLMEYTSSSDAQSAYSVASSGVVNVATGGTITYTDENGLNPRNGTPYEDGYVVHTFTGAGNHSLVSNQAMQVEYLAVGAGGGGGAIGGGGGGGQFLTNAANVVAGTYTITVGAGGVGTSRNASVWTAGAVGGNSIISGPSFSTVTAYGGGGGAGSDQVGSASFGNGGGDSALTSAASYGLNLNRGGYGRLADGVGNYNLGGGGGGAGQPGGSAVGYCSGFGGRGALSSITGVETYYAGGGGGSNRSNITCNDANASNGGLGGGGKGGDATNSYVGQDAEPNTGGGGGGGGYQTVITPYSDPGNGGSGIVVVRYKYSNLQRTAASDIFAQGTRSLKIDAAATSSLNKELRRDISPAINLSNQNKITFSMRASRTGSNIKIGLRDSGGAVSEITPNITTTGDFQEFTWDISTISNVNKDSIDQIIITVVNADENNTVYLDGMVSENQYKIYQVDANTVRLYNYSGTTQDMKLTVNVESQLSLATASVIGKTGTFDTLAADLFSGALGQLTKLNIGNVLSSNAALNIRAATTNSAQINLASSNGINVTNPNEGDLWWNGSNLMFNNGTSNVDLLAAVESIQNIYLNSLVFSAANTTTPNGGYIDVVHSLATNDVIATGWIYNTETSRWEQFNGTQESQTTLDLMEYSTDIDARNAYTASGTAVTAAGGAITYTDSNGLNPSNTPYTDGYVVHTFTGAGYHNLSNVPANTQVDYLLVGGGGGGGEYRGGGGGGGMFVTNASPVTLVGGNYTLYVGDGGASYTGSAAPWSSGDIGEASYISGPSISTIYAYGGAGGAGLEAAPAAFGNGGGDNQNGATNYPGGVQGVGQNDGGASVGNPGGAGGGGGGAGAVGGSGIGYCAGSGGIGRVSSISGTSTYYAGGGGGGIISSLNSAGFVCTDDSAGDGGLGGGGNGGDSTNNFVGQNASDNTGGGGGGAGYQSANAIDSDAGDGGSGIVVIRYPYTATSLQRFAESTIKDQGTYSLKGVAAITDSLNQNISKTFSPELNLSNQNKIFFSMRASRTGQNIKVSIVDAGGTESSITPNITSANVFQDFEWDISSISNTDKDAISSLKFTIVDADAANTFYVDNFRTVNSYKITLVDSDTVRLYNYSGTTQNMKLVVSVQSPDNLVSSQLGYTPLSNGTDYMRGNLGVTGSFSAAAAQFPDLFATNFSATTGNITNLTVTGNLTGIDTLSTNTLWVGNGAAIFTSNDYLTVNSENGMLFNANNLSSFNILNNNVSRFEVTSDSVIANGYFSAGSASLGATSINSINGNLLLSITSTLSTGYFSSPLANKAFNFTTGTIASNDFLSTDFNGMDFVIDADTSNGPFNFYNYFNGNLTLNAEFDGNNNFLRGNLSAATATLASALFRGNVTVSNPAGNTVLNLVSNGGSGNNIELGFYNGSNKLANFAMDSTNTFEFEGASGTNVHFNATNGAYRFWYNGVNKLEIESNIYAPTAYLGLGVAAPGYRIDLPNTASPAGRGRANQWVTYSDITLKENVNLFTNPLEKITSLRGVTFDWKSGGSSDIGFIAQEVEPVLPSIVTTDEYGIKSIDYSRITVVLVEGIKEQQTQITSLSNAVAGMNLASMQSVYDQFVTTLENLSMSTENGALVVNTNLTVTGEALLNNATFTGDVAIGQIKFDSLNNDISINGMDCTNIDGTLNTALCETQTLFVMKNKAGNLNFFDGKVVINPLGEMTVEKIIAGEVAASKVKASEYEVVAGSEVSGNTQILAGQTEITILTSKIKENSKVFVTANGDLEGRSIYVSDKIEGVSFKVKLNQVLTSDVNFDWFILNSE